MSLSKFFLFCVMATVILSAFLPTAAFAWKPGEPIVPCDGSDASPCNWNAAIALAVNLLDFMIYMSVLVAVVLFAFAGFKYMTAGGDVGAIKQSHKIFKNVALGFILVLAAWLIVETILSALVKDPDFSLKKLTTTAPIVDYPKLAFNFSAM